MQNRHAVVLLSGGLDSAVLTYDLHSQGYVVNALSVLYGQKHIKEIESARALATALKIEHKIIDLHALQPLFAGSALTSSSVAIPHGHYNEESMKQTVVPNRNMLLVSIATTWAISCKADVVAYAAHAGDHVNYPDCRPEFVEAIQGAIELCDWTPPKLLTPFVHLSKGQIVKLGTELKVPFEKTWSCYEGKDLHCGECGTCVARKEAFLEAAKFWIRLAMKQYSVKEIYYTLQGEGAHTGRPAVFLRFAGCNLWTGREANRETATCTFCDTDFVGTNGTNGGKYNSVDLAKKVRSLWPGGERPYVVCTGGEPLLQLDEDLIDELHQLGFEVGVETNGTQEQPVGLDWVCVSPKPNTEIKITSGNELKLVYPQSELSPEKVSHLVFEHYFLQPMDGPQRAQNTEKAVAYCLKNPRWRLSLQTHKLIGIP